ncbi:hypothetical protein J699_00066 [Acinetobacter sp. 1000160]|nr:hypothetical protein J522_2004 [Acinetobacter baumannii 146457]EYT23568.1 hypothetical protein J699_00066 [Acinetobacter sp. 1000160]
MKSTFGCFFNVFKICRHSAFLENKLSKILKDSGFINHCFGGNLVLL